MGEAAVREQIKIKRDGLAAKIARVQRNSEFTDDILYKYQAVIDLCDRALALPEGTLVAALASLDTECRVKLVTPTLGFSEVKEERKLEALTLFVDYCRRWTARVETARG